MKLYIVLLLIVSNLLSINAETIVTDEPNPSAFPIISMPVYVRSNDGEYKKNIQSTDFRVWENGREIKPELIKLHCSERHAPMQILLSVDQSTSMEEKINGMSKMYWVKRSLHEFIDNFDFTEYSEIDITSFCSTNYIYSDFTSDKVQLEKAIDDLEVVHSVTDFNKAFLAKPKGAIAQLMKRPNFNRTIIFLTDGGHSSSRGDFLANEILDELIKNNITLYVITISNDYPASIGQLKDICKYSGGASSTGKSANELPDIYASIAKNITNKYNCILQWESNLYCDSVPRLTNLNLKYKYINKYIKYIYYPPEWSVFSAGNDKEIYSFDNPLVNEYSEKEIIIKPTPFDYKIKKASLTSTKYFTIIDWGNNNGKERTNFTVKTGDSVVFKLRFTQLGEQFPRKAIFSLDAEPCPLELDLIGGDIDIDIINPVKDDIFVACNDIKIIWEGLQSKSKKELYYRKDYTSWQLINDNVFGFEYIWTPPQIEGSYQIKIIAYPFIGSNETIEDKSKVFHIKTPQLDILQDNILMTSVDVAEIGNEYFSKVFTNTKKIAVEIKSINISGVDSNSFKINSIDKNIFNYKDTAGINIRFSPQRIGNHKAKLILDLVCGESKEISISGSGKCNTISVDTVDFGNIFINTKRDTIITAILHNPMNTEINFSLYLAGADIEKFGFNKNYNSKYKLAANESFEIQLFFKPTDLGRQNAYIFFSIDGCTNKKVYLVGDGIYEGIIVNNLDFKNQRYKTEFEILDIMITNKDVNNKMIDSVRYENTAYKDIFQINTLEFPIPIGSYKEISIPVEFIPNAVDTFETNIFIYTNKGDILTSILKGRTWLPSLISESTCETDIPIGDTSYAIVKLTNNSKTRDLSIIDVQIQKGKDEFLLLNNSIPQLLSIDSTIELRYQYIPVDNGQHTAEIIVLADNYFGDYNKPSKENLIEITCDALELSHTIPIFGNVFLCNSQLSTFTITNKASSLDLEVFWNNAIISGDDMNSFRIFDYGSNIISAYEGENIREVKVEFTTVHTGIHNAILTIPTNTENDIIIKLTGNGKELNYYASPKNIRYIPGNSGIIDFIIDIPDIDKGYVDSLELYISYDDNMLFINNNSYQSTLSTDNSKNEYMIIDSIYNKIGTYKFFKIKCRLLANKTYNLFSYKYLGLFSDIKESQIYINIHYPCLHKYNNVVNVTREVICQDNNRIIQTSGTNFYIEEIIPLPSNKTITLNYGIGFETNVTATLIDMLGNEIAILINEKRMLGNYQEKYDISIYEQGTYFINFQAGNFKAIRQILIIK